MKRTDSIASEFDSYSFSCNCCWITFEYIYKGVQILWQGIKYCVYTHLVSLNQDMPMRKALASVALYYESTGTVCVHRLRKKRKYALDLLIFRGQIGLTFMMHINVTGCRINKDIFWIILKVIRHIYLCSLLATTSCLFYVYIL